MSSRTRTRLMLALPAAAAVLALLAGCSGGASEMSGTDAGAPAVGGESSGAADGSGGAVTDDQGRQATGDDDAPEAKPGEVAPGVAGADSASAVAAATQPRTIRRGAVTIEVDDLTRTAAQVRDTAASLMGYVSQESINLAPVGGDGVPGAAVAPDQGLVSPDGAGDQSAFPVPPYNGPGQGTLLVRVPTASMTEAMDAFARLGTELNRWSSETEVEGALVDLESRVATQRASVERVRALLERATSLSDIVTLERELSQREADLESLEAQRESLAGRAALASVTVVMQTADRAVQVEQAGGFLGGLHSGWKALSESTVVLLTIVGAVLPFAIVVALVLVPLVVWRRRLRREAAPESLA